MFKRRREFIRHKCLHEIKYSFDSKNENKADILNISRDGALIRMTQILDSEDCLEIQFENKGMPIYNINCIVKYRKNNLIGIQFIKNSSEDEEFINELIKKLQEKRIF